MWNFRLNSGIGCGLDKCSTKYLIGRWNKMKWNRKDLVFLKSTFLNISKVEKGEGILVKHCFLLNVISYI